MVDSGISSCRVKEKKKGGGETQNCLPASEMKI